MIKYLIFTFTILNLMNVNPQVESRRWAVFNNVEKMEFSINFMKEMSKQLKQKFEKELGCDSCCDELGFSLIVGEVDQTIAKVNDSMNLKVEITNSYDRKWGLTCNWTSKNFHDSLQIHKSDVIGEMIEFGWGIDFPKNEFLKIINSRQSFPKSETNLKFDLDIYYDTYPPEQCQVIFINPPRKKELKEINNFFRNYQRSHPYFAYGDLTNYLDEPRYLNSLILQIPEWNKSRFELEIYEIFQLLSESIESQNIHKIILCH
jgi:hypothetical protein